MSPRVAGSSSAFLLFPLVSGSADGLSIGTSSSSSTTLNSVATTEPVAIISWLTTDPTTECPSSSSSSSSGKGELSFHLFSTSILGRCIALHVEAFRTPPLKIFCQWRLKSRTESSSASTSTENCSATLTLEISSPQDNSSAAKTGSPSLTNLARYSLSWS